MITKIIAEINQISDVGVINKTKAKRLSLRCRLSGNVMHNPVAESYTRAQRKYNSDRDERKQYIIIIILTRGCLKSLDSFI